MSSAGEKRHWVRLRVPYTSDDGKGGQTETFADDMLLAALVRDVTGREQSIAGTIQSMATHVVEIGYHPSVTGACRLRRIDPQGPDLQILGVRNPDGKQREMHLDCSEAVANE
jgi:SPP1 family predicted phage head-tail adaptor